MQKTEYIRLRTKEDFKKARDEYKNISGVCWKMYMWNNFKEYTCYIPTEDVFISLDKAEVFRFIERKKLNNSK